VKDIWIRIVNSAILAGLLPFAALSQTTTPSQPHGPFARIAIMRAINESHTVDFEAGYIRHLEWHRQAKDPFNWYSYSVWASDERQRWIIYATFGHTAEELSNPVSPAEDERDSAINVLPHVQFTGNTIYEFLPALSHGNGVPTATARVEYTTVDLKYGAERAFETALAEQQPRLQYETLWYRLAVGGNAPRYVCLRPRKDLAGILEDRNQLPEKVSGVVAKITIESLNLRSNMLVNVTQEPVR